MSNPIQKLSKILSDYISYVFVQLFTSIEREETLYKILIQKGILKEEEVDSIRKAQPTNPANIDIEANDLVSVTFRSFQSFSDSINIEEDSNDSP